MQRVALITGASSGIGRETARELTRRGWRVGVAGRNPERTHATADALGAEAFVADFDSLEQVRHLAADALERLRRVDVLINNAGGIVDTRQLSADGNELTLQRNVLGSVVLTEALLPELHERQGRIIHTSSIMHRVGSLDMDDLDYSRRSYRGGWAPYADSKLGVVMYSNSLVKRSGIESFPVHPGYVASNFGPDTAFARSLLRLTRPLQISVPAGAAPLVHLADTPELGVDNGTYFDGLNPFSTVHPTTKNAAQVQRYWEELVSRVG